VTRNAISYDSGDVVCIDLANGLNAFARVLYGPLIAFYDIVDESIPGLTAITSSTVLFKLPVMVDALESGRWPIVGSKRLEEGLLKPVAMFKQDALNKSLSLYIEHPDGNHEERLATWEECEGLERAAVWSPEHIEDRLRDQFAGLKNQWVESLKLK